MENIKNTFNNPFEDINANVMDPKKILDFWCDPFASGFLEIKGDNFYSEKMPIILEGSRGSGKTTILKYFSFDVQFELSKKREDHSYTKQVKDDGGIGIYFRCDESFIRTFQIIFNNNDKSVHTTVFEHYFELFIIKNIFEIIGKMDNNESFEDYILNEMKIKRNVEFDGFSEFKEYILSEISYIDSYKNNAIFTDEEFTPKKMFSIYYLSSVMIKCLRKVETSWKSVNFLILIDEFENLDFELQRRFNTLLKFTENYITFRIGRRSEGLIISETVNNTEYLRVNNDYILIPLLNEDIKTKNKTKKYFEEIAQKRFNSFSEYKNIEISHIFGSSENLNWEASVLAKNKKEHIYQILRSSSSLKGDDDLLNSIVDSISYPEDPIAEMLNALWLIRSKNSNKLEAAKEIKEIMLAALLNNKSETNLEINKRIKKYKSDYTNKYKYSLVVLMNSIYRKQKLYYSFNTICYLSNSNARMFMNFCRAIIDDALFYERKKFLKTKKITQETQSRAIHEVSLEEFNNVRAIIKYGQKIGNLVQNIGNVLSDFHKDKKVRYPETNQFVFDLNNLSGEYKEIINVAQSWAVIIKRPKKQRATVNIDRKTSIYYLNRAYTPIFNISYRTRGGFNPEFTSEEIQNMCDIDKIEIYKIDKDRNSNDVDLKNSFEQLNLFEIEDLNE